MVVGVHLFVGLCGLPLYLLPESLQPLGAIIFLVVFWPATLYWGFTIFFPDAYSTPPEPVQPAFTPKVCFSCTASMPAGSSVCPSCGWTFKAREHANNA